jgi:hypothetical protein
MKNKKTLLDVWVALWKFHLLFYPIYLWIIYDMVPELYNSSNENNPIVQKLIMFAVVIMGVIGGFRFVYIWYKDIYKKRNKSDN